MAEAFIAGHIEHAMVFDRILTPDEISVFLAIGRRPRRIKKWIQKLNTGRPLGRRESMRVRRTWPID